MIDSKLTLPRKTKAKYANAIVNAVRKSVNGQD